MRLGGSQAHPGRGQRRVAEATMVAGLISGAPSTAYALATRGPHGAVAYGLDAVRAIGVLVPSGRPGVFRGLIAHAVISAGAGQLLGYYLPRRNAVAWAAVAGAAMGILNVALVGRRFPTIRALPLGPQLADNIVFGILFAAVADRERQ